MEILLKRETRTNTSTIGQLSIDGAAECYTLEDCDRGLAQTMTLAVVLQNKLRGKTAIPSGRYEVIVNWSNRFARQMPLLLNVTGFDGIRIHPGNIAADTLGCILLGQGKETNTVTSSRIAFNLFFNKLLATQGKEKVFITIT